MAAATGLIDAAEATRNPYAFSFALLAYGFAFRDADPDRALEAIAPGLGDRSRQRQPRHRDPPGGQSGPTRSRTTATRSPRSDTSLWRSATTTTSGNTPNDASRHWLPSPRVSTGSDDHEAAAIIAGFAYDPLTTAVVGS